MNKDKLIKWLEEHVLIMSPNLIVNYTELLSKIKEGEFDE